MIDSFVLPYLIPPNPGRLLAKKREQHLLTRPREIERPPRVWAENWTRAAHPCEYDGSRDVGTETPYATRVSQTLAVSVDKPPYLSASAKQNATVAIFRHGRVEVAGSEFEPVTAGWWGLAFAFAFLFRNLTKYAARNFCRILAEEPESVRLCGSDASCVVRA